MHKAIQGFLSRKFEDKTKYFIRVNRVESISLDGALLHHELKSHDDSGEGSQAGAQTETENWVID